MDLHRWTVIFRDDDAEPESMQVMGTSLLVASSVASRQVAKLAPDATIVGLIRADVDPKAAGDEHRKRLRPGRR